jgi:hypothetical protein
MSDTNSSLPVRTESAGDLAVKIVDSTITSQQLKVNADGSVDVNVLTANVDIRDLAFATDKVDVTGSDVTATISDGGGSITVDGTVELGATTLAALETITVGNGSGGSAVNIQDGGNSITVDGTVELGSTTLAALESITVQNGAGVSAVNIQDGGNSITVDGSVTVSAANLDIRDLSHTQDSVKIGDGTDLLSVNADGSINVVVTSSVAGTPVCDYATGSAIASGATSTHDYTTASAMKLTGILASASGKIKVEVKVETAAASGVFNTKFVAFNSTATPNINVFPTGDLMVASGAKVRVIITNKDNQSQDVYSTIEGSEI